MSVVASRSGRIRAAVACAACTLLGSAAAKAEWLSMERAIALAQARSVPVVDAAGQIGLAQAAGVGARISSIGNPYMEVIADRSEFYSGSNRTLPTPHFQVIAQMWIPFDFAGQRSARIEEADRFMEWRRLGMVGARSQALGEVVEAYGQAVVARARISEAQRGEEAARSEAQYFAARLEAKDSTVYEVRLAEAEVARWVQLRGEAELRVTGALSRLSQLTAVSPLDVPPADAEYRTPQLHVTWENEGIAKAVDRAPLITALRSEQGFWNASQERAERDKYAPLSLILHGGRGDQAEPKIGAGLAWSFPILRRNQGEIARAGAERSRAAALEGAFRKVIDARIRGALASYQTSQNTLVFLEREGLPATQGALDAAQQSFRAGKLEIFRVLLARRDLATAHFRRFDLLEVMWRAYAELAALTGSTP
jgi:outer membrane protein, heavy metal efflux system